MSNAPNHPGTDTPEPILPDEHDDDAVGTPVPDGDGQRDTMPTPDVPGAPGPDVVSPDLSWPL